MGPWIALLTIPMFIGFFYRNKSSNRIVVIIISSILLFAFRAFRADTVGGDLERYKLLYESVGTVPWSDVWLYIASGYEIGYIVYYKFLNTLSHNFQIELIATALLFTIGLFVFIFRKSKQPGYSLFIYITMYFYGATFNNERQAIPIVLLMISTIFISSRCLWKYCTCILLACLFHTSSIIFFPIYFLYNVKLSIKYWIAVLGIGVTAFLMSRYIMTYVINTIYTKYEGEDLMEGGGYSYFALLFLIVLSTLLFYNRKERSNPEKRIWIHMLVVATVLQLLSFTNGYFYRAVTLYSVAMVIYLPDALNSIRNKNSILLSKFLLAILLFGIYCFYLSNDSLGLVPYVSVLKIF